MSSILERGTGKTRTLATPLQNRIGFELAIKLSETIAELIPCLCKTCQTISREKIPSFDFEIEKMIKQEERLTREGNRREEMEFEQFHDD